MLAKDKCRTTRFQALRGFTIVMLRPHFLTIHNNESTTYDLKISTRARWSKQELKSSHLYQIFDWLAIAVYLSTTDGWTCNKDSARLTAAEEQKLTRSFHTYTIIAQSMITIQVQIQGHSGLEDEWQQLQCKAFSWVLHAHDSCTAKYYNTMHIQGSFGVILGIRMICR